MGEPGVDLLAGTVWIKKDIIPFLEPEDNMILSLGGHLKLW
jgi:hypothetical protein